MLNNDEIQKIIADIESGAYDVSDVLEAIASAAKGEDVRAALYASVYATKNAAINGQPKIVTEAANMKNPEIKYLYLGNEMGYTYGYIYANVDGEWVKTSLYGKGERGYSPSISVSDTESGIRILFINETGTITKDINNGTATDAQVETYVADWLDEHPEATTTVADGSITIDKLGEDVLDAISFAGGLTDGIKTALLNLAQKLAYVDENGETYYQELYDAFYPPVPAMSVTLSANSLSFIALGATQTLTATVIPVDTTDEISWSSSDESVATVNNGVVTSVDYGNATITATAGEVSATCSVVVAQVAVDSISAVYTQSGTVYDISSLDSLKSDLVVTATLSDSSTMIVDASDYTLTGTLTAGTSTVTVSYSGATTTFTVTVTEYVPQVYTIDSPTAQISANTLTLNEFINGEINVSGLESGSTRMYILTLPTPVKVTIETNSGGYSLGYYYAVMNGELWAFNGNAEWRNLSQDEGHGGTMDVRNKSATTPYIATQVAVLARSRNLSKCKITEVV